MIQEMWEQTHYVCGLPVARSALHVIVNLDYPIYWLEMKIHSLNIGSFPADVFILLKAL